MKKLLVVVAFIACGTIAATSNATVFDIKICADYLTGYSDVGIGEDYWTNNAYLKIARGISIQVHENGGPQIYNDFASQDTGCTEWMELDSTKEYSIYAYSSNYVRQNYVFVRNNDDNNNCYAWVVDTDFSPEQDTVINTVSPNTKPWWVTAAIVYGAWSKPGAMTGKQYFVYAEQECDGGGSCTDSGEIFLSNWGRERKYIITHELGHAMTYMKSGGAAFSYNADVDNCYTDTDRKHELCSKEYQTAAAVEGIAHFFAALVWNNFTTQTNCWFGYYKSTDLDLDAYRDIEVPDEIGWGVNCEGTPYVGVGNDDYLGDECTGTLTARGTEYDWLRFWWDMASDEGVDWKETLDIWDGASPGSWTAATVHDDLEDSADTEGFLTEWQTWNEVNGIHR